MPDRRKSTRRRTFLGGRISLDKLETFDVGCTVRNLSDGGARLTLDDNALVPSTFRLGISGGERQRGRLVWYRGGEIGVAFGEAPAADAPIPARAADTRPANEPPLQARMQAIMVRRRAANAGFTCP